VQAGEFAQKMLLPRFPCRLVWSPRKPWEVKTSLPEEQVARLFTERMTSNANLLRKFNDYFRRARWEVQRNAISGELIAKCNPTGQVSVGFGKNKFYVDVSNDTMCCQINQPNPKSPTDVAIGPGTYTTLFGLYAYPAPVYSFDIVKAIKRADRDATVKYPWSPARMIMLAATIILLIIAASSSSSNNNTTNATFTPTPTEQQQDNPEPTTASETSEAENQTGKTAETPTDESETASTEPAAALTAYDGPGYTASVPEGWRTVEDDVQKPGYKESKWQQGASFMLIDTQQADRSLTLEQDAAPVHRDLERLSSYEELSYGSGDLSDFQSWEWVFRADGAQRVDYFFNRCDRGFGVLGSTTPGDFEGLRSTFKAVAESVEISC
jgi:hypothetical protein